MKLLLFVDLERRMLVGGLNDSNAATLPVLMQGDDVDVILQGVEKNSSTAVNYYRPVPIPFAKIKCGISIGPDVPPVDGTIRWALVDGDPINDVTEAFGPGITKPDLQAKLNLLPGVIAKGGVKVLTTNAAPNIFRIRWNTATETALFAFRENLLEPRSDTRSMKVDLPNGQMQVMKYRQLPLAFTDQFSLPQPPVIMTDPVRSGNSTRNCIQSITTPRNSIGQVHFTFASLSTRILSVSGLTPSAVSGALNDLFSDGIQRFAVTQPSSALLYVECIGPLANTDAPEIAAVMHDQAPLDTPMAKLPLGGPTLEMAFDGAKQIDRFLELEITDTDGEVGTPIQTAVTLRNDIIDGGMALGDDPNWLEKTDPTRVPYDPSNPVISAPGAYVTPIGSTGGVGSDFIVEHNLGTSNVHVTVRETNGERLRIPDSEYVCKILDDNRVEISFADVPNFTWSTPPTEGQFEVVISAVVPREIALPHHTHPISDIIGLQDILDALENGINPNAPINDKRLPKHISWWNYKSDGSRDSLRFDQVPNELIPGNIPRLNANTGRLDAKVMPFGVPYVGTDGGLWIDFPGPPVKSVEILKPVTDGNGNTTYQLTTDIFPTDFTTLPGFLESVIKALQVGAIIPLGYVPMFITPLQESFPPAVVMREGVPPVPASLPRAWTNFSDAGNYAGALPLPTATTPGTLYTVVDGASSDPVRWRARQTWFAGTKVLCDGQQWFEVRVEGNTAYPVEMERELFTVHVTQAMMAVNSRFACNGALFLSLTGPCAKTTRGRVVLRVQVGAINGPDIHDISFGQAVIEVPIILGSTQVAHTFGFSVINDSNGAIRATASLYGVGTVAPVPPSLDFMVRASLVCFDLEDATGNTTGAAPVGQFNVELRNAIASVARLKGDTSLSDAPDGPPTDPDEQAAYLRIINEQSFDAADASTTGFGLPSPIISPLGNYYGGYIGLTAGSFTANITTGAHTLTQDVVLAAGNDYTIILRTDAQGQPFATFLDDNWISSDTAKCRIFCGDSNITQDTITFQTRDPGGDPDSPTYTQIGNPVVVTPGEAMVEVELPNVLVFIHHAATAPNNVTASWDNEVDFTYNRSGSIYIHEDAYGRFRPRAGYNGHDETPENDGGE